MKQLYIADPSEHEFLVKKKPIDKVLFLTS